jgi:hypothetical protein
MRRELRSDFILSLLTKAKLADLHDRRFRSPTTATKNSEKWPPNEPQRLGRKNPPNHFRSLFLGEIIHGQARDLAEPDAAYPD